ncbi:hypothetical protein MTP04_33020 [Lysinibacillus sp. PLM2]|nr:hypothetical protein MTP04_33020 [Lysinibacillus sp. PLM2]
MKRMIQVVQEMKFGFVKKLYLLILNNRWKAISSLLICLVFITMILVIAKEEYSKETNSTKELQPLQSESNEEVTIEPIQVVSTIDPINIEPEKKQGEKETASLETEESDETIVEEELVDEKLEVAATIDPSQENIMPITEPQPPFPYSEALPLPYEHQEYLYSLCMDYGLDYEKALAVMEHESKFDPNAIGATSDFGYFQINAINHEWLSKTLSTPNDPLDPYVNIQWGTYMLDYLFDYWEEKGLTGVALEDAVLSSYNKGITGFQRTGKATTYINKVRESYILIQNSLPSHIANVDTNVPS